MEQGFLIDTDILIYYLNGQIPDRADRIVSEAFEKSFNISVISKIELLGWHKFTKAQYNKAELLISAANIYPLDNLIVDDTIAIKRKLRIRIPDAIIASTCLINNLTLMTGNEKDFVSIEGLKIYNPFKE
jgi:predicted nucleic acid-binding protein